MSLGHNGGSEGDSGFVGDGDRDVCTASRLISAQITSENVGDTRENVCVEQAMRTGPIFSSGRQFEPEVCLLDARCRRILSEFTLDDRDRRVHSITGLKLLKGRTSCPSDRVLHASRASIQRPAQRWEIKRCIY